jgi:FAD synthase
VLCHLLPPADAGQVTDGALAGDVIRAPCESAGAAARAGPILAGVASIGRRPTFDNGTRRLEVYLLDFDADIYGRCLRVEFVRRLRPELRFDSVEALVSQMRSDVAESRTVLSSDRAVPEADRG